jgi:hypothetical protein
MAVKATQSIAVGTTAVALTTSPTTDLRPGASAALVNTGTATVYLGPAGVTAANGFPWTTSIGPLSFDLDAGEVLYGICASGQSSTVAVLETGV